MLDYFVKTKSYLAGLDLSKADPLDKKINELINDPATYERASQALRRRFVRGASEVEAVDRSSRKTKIKRERIGGTYKYKIQGVDGNWFEPEERIWVVAMYALWQDSK
ncbi:hypothetical protein A2865_01530 [Candidatus Woesebacteria bacterium RIFCSPHIGHO2_01_FULL_39_17]|uniref:Uncharacterized protein n=3 Tax=Candidatus Woeseibacteriota TaxID=1752722 RepID=A0A0G0NDD6_9BACT|nr:MAG: hypothetical protein US72_C0014G0031 [Microgenomates group bacterium GW2011_GWC1_38_12]KKQ93576.1 MAG: hypothetical protein UT19_C0010G0020 [Candidatus Woesebacteria bacterium GW2011_GWB1_39_10b]KKR13523.1 MAG: hypothetical protein UT40_C0015G0020 [Candidatus Woesebacteria bacterium GW2011_GWA1_39_21b]OGM22878.1 MAG: hypothetical protein A2865_01530 [Candidatus Woesebacteria bacterium RIFCSPHIGHO2_01_FULL_39_17]OGM61931.1 MAG: hypothetical protein A3A52_00100 [Candidatus Woesebacteria b